MLVAADQGAGVHLGDPPDGRAGRRPITQQKNGRDTVGQASERLVAVGLLTGGGDKPYALGLASALIGQGIFLDFIGSDEVNGPELHRTRQVTFLNLRGDQRREASRARKALRVLAYYGRLIRYAASSKPKVFHILWNNKFEWFDRTVLMLYYRLLGKRVVFTAHNVNAGKRDANDTVINRLSLRAQYGLSDHIFVHTQKMKSELIAEFSVPDRKVSVIPFGINNTIPDSGLTTGEAKRLLGVSGCARTMLFFGNIAPYKGLEYLISALEELARTESDYRLIIAGNVKNCGPYWKQVQAAISRTGLRERIIERIEYIPDDQVEAYFKAADVLILPYAHIFQSGVLFLAYHFGLPAIASDVGSLREEVVEGRTGFVCRAMDAGDLARAIGAYFSSDLFKNLESRRPAIRDYANQRYSWTRVGEMTREVYLQLLEG